MFSKKLKILISLSLLMIIVFTSTGCVFVKENEEALQAIELYYVKKSYLDGEVEKDAFIMYRDAVAIPKEILGQDNSRILKYAAESALKSLKVVPSDIEDEATTVVSKQLVFNGVDVNYGTAVVDIDSQSLETVGGSTEESVFISQIVSTLLSSFDEIHGVKFLVDGKEQDSLMGHIDISGTFVSPTIN